MKKTALEARHISKSYLSGKINSGTLIRDFERWRAGLFGKPDPYRSADTLLAQSTGVSWALRNVSFDIYQGDIVALTGENGAGKSTLLKILSRITAPTTGSICGNGKLISLLEAGTGFHPELTGLENIYLMGAMLGMGRKAICEQIASIAAFSEMSTVLDRPVKRYSSGMYSKLAFSIATHLEADILIADEVFSTTDVRFRKKGMQKLDDLSKEGKTIIMVSHHLNDIESLCTREIKLENGRIVK